MAKKVAGTPRARHTAAPETPFTIAGGPSKGYTICLHGEPLKLHFDKMWEAIDVRDALRAGKPMIDFELALAQAA